MTGRLDQQALAEYRYRAMREVLGGSPVDEVAERMSPPRAPRRSTKLSPGPYSVRRMTEHDHWRESTAHEVEERLRFLCLQARLTQAQLADELGTTQSAIARLERGLHRTSLEVIKRVATAMVIEQRRTA